SLGGDDERLAFQQGQDVGTVQDESIHGVDDLDLAVHDRSHVVGRFDVHLGSVGQGGPQLAQAGAGNAPSRVGEAVEQLLRAAGLVQQLGQRCPDSQGDQEAVVQAL